MALVLGTNCGFVETAPTTDPAGVTEGPAERCNAVKDTSSATAARVVEMGWWAKQASSEANFELGIYSDAGAGEPELQLHVSATNAKGTTSGWKVVTGLDWAIDPSTTYWLAMECDDATPNEQISFTGSGSNYAFVAGTTLPADWGTSGGTGSGVYAIYARWEAAASSTVGALQRSHPRGALRTGHSGAI